LIAVKRRVVKLALKRLCTTPNTTPREKGLRVRVRVRAKVRVS